MSNSFKFRHGDWDFEIDQIRRLYNKEHTRTKPKLVAVNSTGGFGITKHNKKGTHK